MTIVEFLHPIRAKSLRDVCLAALYFAHRYEGVESLSVEALRALLRRGHIPRATKLNLADVLAKSAPFVDTVGKEGSRFLWALTTTGQQHVRTLLNLPATEAEIENDVTSLVKLTAKISDPNVADYVKESITCLSVNALRAAVVFVWAGAVKTIRDLVFACGASAVTTALVKHDPKARPVKHIDDLVYPKETTLLIVAQDLGIYDKNQRGILEDCLDLRNKCGHPGKYKIGPKKVSALIEDLVGIVFK